MQPLTTYDVSNFHMYSEFNNWNDIYSDEDRVSICRDGPNLNPPGWPL